MRVELPPRRFIKDQIFRNGKRNQLRYINREIAFQFWGYMDSHISFVPQRQLNVSKYPQAVESLHAAILKLQKLELYTNNHPEDRLWSFYYDLFKEFVKTGDPSYMDQMKEVLWFVKYPERGDVGDYSMIGYDRLKQLSYYQSTATYPWDYIEMYDIINEWDIVITDDMVDQCLDDYRDKYLSESVYETQNATGLLDEVRDSLDIVVRNIRKNKRLLKKMRAFLSDPKKYRMGKIGNAKCGTGDKRDFFHNLYSRGISPAVADICFKMIDRLNLIYDSKYPYPEVKDTGLNQYEFCMALMVLPDPKKARYAYRSNPIMDYIGDYAMDFLALVFEAMPWIKTGHKRVSQVDQLIDHSRYEDTKNSFEYADQYSIDLMSTDLTKATENQNMDAEIELIHELVERIGLSEYWGRLKESLLQLKDTPIVLEYKSEDRRDGKIYFTRWGQCQGVPSSFHAMTFTLALLNFQTLVEDGYCNDLVDSDEDELYRLACKILQNNGDDGNNLTSSKRRFKELLELLTDPDGKRQEWSVKTGQPKEEVFNTEKSCSMKVNRSLEFCKSMYYKDNPELVVGYRMSSVYKMLGGGITAQRYLLYPRFKHDKHVFTKMAVQMKELIPTVTQYPNGYDTKYRRIDTLLKIDERPDIMQEIVDDVYAIRINNLEEISDELMNIEGSTDGVPVEVMELLHHNSYFRVVKEGLLSVGDMQTMDSLFERLDSSLYDSDGVSPEEAFLDDSQEQDLLIWRLERKILEDSQVKRYEMAFQMDGHEVMITTLDVPVRLKEMLGSSTIVLTTRENDTRAFRSVCSVLEDKQWATIEKYGSEGLTTSIDELSYMKVTLENQGC